MLIICNGGYRTGSTLVYNLARLLVENFATGYARAGIAPAKVPQWIEDYEIRPELVVIKSHHYIHKSTRALAIYTYRNPLDVAASHVRLIQRRGIVDSRSHEDLVDAWKAEMERYFEQKNKPYIIMVQYEPLFVNSTPFLVGLSKRLNFPLTVDDAQYLTRSYVACSDVICKQLIQDQREGDNATQLRLYHKGEWGGAPGAWRQVLPQALAKMIVEGCRQWFEDVPDYESCIAEVLCS